MILGQWFFDWLACIARCVRREWPDCAVPCWQPCFPAKQYETTAEQLREIFEASDDRIEQWAANVRRA